MNAQSCSLLVVDNDDLNRDMLTSRLNRLGYRVASCKNGREARTRIPDTAFDLVLLDVLPGREGLEILTTIRETPSLADVRVIMTALRDQPGDVVTALRLGANDYLFKPVNFLLLRAQIQTQLAMKAAHGARRAADVATAQVAAPPGADPRSREQRLKLYVGGVQASAGPHVIKATPVDECITVPARPKWARTPSARQG